MKHILILDGSLGEESGNTQEIIDRLIKKISDAQEGYEVIHLKHLLDKKISLEQIKTQMQKADGFIFTSGTYWDSWGSPLQYFLEVSTQFEASDIFMGKSAAVIITMHSVGGKAVLSRLQGVLNTLGLLIPPMSGMVYSLAGKLALQTDSSFADDFWSLEDADIVFHNLLVSLHQSHNYQAWPIDHKDPKRIWIK